MNVPILRINMAKKKLKPLRLYNKKPKCLYCGGDDSLYNREQLLLFYALFSTRAFIVSIVCEICGEKN